MPFAIEIASFGNAAAPVSCGAVMGCPATGRRAPALRRRCSVRGGRSRLCAELQGMRRHENPAPTGVLAAGRPRRGGGLAAGWRLALAAPWPFPLLAAGARRVSPPPVGRGRQPPTGAAGVGSGAPSAWRAAPAPPGARVPGTPLFVVASRRQMAAGHPPPGGAPQPPGAVDGGAGNLSPAPLRRGVVRCAAPQRAAQSAALALPPPGAGRCAARSAALGSARPAPVLRWVPAATSARGMGFGSCALRRTCHGCCGTL